ncbi:hypothetical protein ES703_02614 [subsurface metagenome]
MGRGTKLRTVIDWGTLKIVGQAHTGCARKKSKHQDLHFYPVGDPSAEQIAFSKKLRDFIFASNDTWVGHQYPPHEFHKRLLASEALFKVSTVEQWANLNRVKYLTDWWLNGSKIISQKEHDSLFEWIADFDKVDKEDWENPSC